MSEENVEIARQMTEAFNRGDVDAYLKFCAPDFEVRDLPQLEGSSVAVGHKAVRAWWDQLSETLEGFRVENEELIDAGDHVVGVNHATARGGGSGADVEMHFASVLALEDGKAVRLASYSARSAALEAAGLRE